MSRFVSGKRVVVLGAAVAALAFGVSASLATSGPSDWKVPVYLFNNNCPPKIGAKPKKVVSVARVEQTKGVYTVKGQTHGAFPGKYDVELWQIDQNTGTCLKFFTFHDGFNVDGSGDGNYKAFGFNFGGKQTFELNLFNTDFGINNFSFPFWLGSS